MGRRLPFGGETAEVEYTLYDGTPGAAFLLLCAHVFLSGVLLLLPLLLLLLPCSMPRLSVRPSFPQDDQKEGMAAFAEKRSPKWTHK